MAGYYCAGSDIQQDPLECSSGYYCPEGTPVEMACPPATFNSKSLSRSTSVEMACPPATFNSKSLSRLTPGEMACPPVTFNSKSLSRLTPAEMAFLKFFN